LIDSKTHSLKATKKKE